MCLSLELLLALSICRGEKQVPPEKNFSPRWVGLSLKVHISLQQ